ncbi:MAG: acyl-CoA dehydrogenase family protein [Thermodesulfobacteriota bacterium]|nr:acyl-CoA dehydrogenase family protein [Thermodesulfobacteriota bacterium]
MSHTMKSMGAGADKICDAIINLEIGRVSMAFAATLSSQMLSIFPIKVFGSEEQKEKFFPVAISGEKTFAFGMTEPNAGSDSANIEMKATKEGGVMSSMGQRCLLQMVLLPII